MATQQKSGRERRVHRRIDFQTEVLVQVGEETIHGVCLNISQGGMFIESKRYDIGSVITIKFNLPDIEDPVETEARVCWAGSTTEKTGIGVQFVSLRAREVWAINQIFDRARRSI